MSLISLGSKPPPGFDRPIDMLRACHRRIEGHLATLNRAVAALRDPAAHAEALEALAGVTRYFDHAGVRHSEDEEFSLFPRLQDDATRAVLDELASEHRQHEAIYLAVRAVIERLRESVTPALVDELATHAAAMTAAYADHIRREEAEVFPAADALDAPQLRAIGLEMRLRRGGEEP